MHIMARQYKQIFKIPIGQLLPIVPHLSHNHNCSQQNYNLVLYSENVVFTSFLSLQVLFFFFLFFLYKNFSPVFFLLSLSSRMLFSSFFLFFLSLLVLFFFFLLSFFFIVAIKFKIVQLTIPTHRQSIGKCQSPPRSFTMWSLEKSQETCEDKNI